MKFDGQLGTWLKKSKIKDQTRKDTNIGAEIDWIRG